MFVHQVCRNMVACGDHMEQWGHNGYIPVAVQALDWSNLAHDLVDSISSSSQSSTSLVETLSIDQVMEMRVRDIKWRLTRQHGYSADELARMIDKKELIQALAFEEEKVRLESLAELQRTVVQRGIFWTVVAIVVSILWPVLKQGKDILMVNFAVYTDRKKFEAQRCWELQSSTALLGVGIMFVLDALQLWLYVSILLSWFISRSPYFFPVPYIPIRPANLIGGEARKAFGGYGINVGSMAVTWGLRFLHGQVEAWTGRVILKAQKRRKKARTGRTANTGKKKNETPPATCAHREQVILQEHLQEHLREDHYIIPNAPPTSLPDQWMEAVALQEEESSDPPTEPPAMRGTPGTTKQNPSVPITTSHIHFLEQLNEADNNDMSDWNDVMDELD